jgi:hypothetical protein
MKNWVKRVVLLGVTLMLCFGFLSGCGSNYTYQEDDFRLTVTVDKTEAVVGETVTVTAIFENISGQNIRVQGWSARQKLDDILIPVCIPDRPDFSAGIGGTAGFIPRRTFRKDASIKRQITCVIEESTNHNAYAVVLFSVGKEHQLIEVRSETVRITVKGDE